MKLQFLGAAGTVTGSRYLLPDACYLQEALKHFESLHYHERFEPVKGMEVTLPLPGISWDRPAFTSITGEATARWCSAAMWGGRMM